MAGEVARSPLYLLLPKPQAPSPNRYTLHPSHFSCANPQRSNVIRDSTHLRGLMKALSTLLALTMLAVPAPAAAQGWIDPVRGHPGQFGVAKVRTEVTVRVTGRIAQVEVEEWFQNRGPALGEGDYLYPLPGEAVFSNFSLFQGDEELRGEMMDATQARSIYEEIVRRKRDPALVELVGHGLIRARVFPINQGETRKITLRYTQIMERAGDALQFRYAAGGRRAPTVNPRAGADPSPPYAQETVPLSFTLIADDGAMFRDPFSPTHRVRVERRDGQLRVRPEGSLQGSFTVFLPLAERAVGITVATHRPSSAEQGYFMLTLSPGEAAGSAQVRDLTVVMDISGSMSGVKLEQAKAALRQLLDTLDPADRFRLISFNNGITTYRAEWTQASRRHLAEAREWINALAAGGGTNIAGALDEAFRLSSPSERLPIVLFLTDGLPSVGEKDPERIATRAESLRREARVFAFGVGYDVNTFLLDRLTEAGRGTTQYVAPGEDVEGALSTLAAKIRHPVMTDLELAESPVRFSEVYPVELPDLFAGEELVLFGRYEVGRRDRSGPIAVRGQRNGQEERFATGARFAAHELGNDFIPRLWASRKLGYLTRTLRLEGHNPEVVEDIRATALRYGLLSEYSSYLVQEPQQVAQDPTRLVPMDRSAVAPGRGTRGAGSPSAPAASAVGKTAVEEAERSRRQREARFTADLDEVDDFVASRSDGAATQHVAGRMFTLVDEVWTDVQHADSMPVTTIEPYSDAYFDLLRLAPELEQWFVSFEHVLVAGVRGSIQIAAGGSARLDSNALSELVREYRGN